MDSMVEHPEKNLTDWTDLSARTVPSLCHDPPGLADTPCEHSAPVQGRCSATRSKKGTIVVTEALPERCIHAGHRAPGCDSRRSDERLVHDRRQLGMAAVCQGISGARNVLRGLVLAQFELADQAFDLDFDADNRRQHSGDVIRA